MEKRSWLILGIILITLFLTGCGTNKNNQNNFNYDGPIKVRVNMSLRSSAFLHEEQIPLKYGCDGSDINPPLQFFGVPDDIESLALVVDDPDADNGGWTHWLVWNIDPKTKIIKENSVPVGAVEGVTDFNTLGWSGPCPPVNQHLYNFKLYALDTMLDISNLSRKADLIKAMRGHIVQQATLSGYYIRK